MRKQPQSPSEPGEEPADHNGPGGRHQAAVDYGPLPTLLGYRIRRAQITVFQDFAERLADAQITPGQLGLLILIDHNAGISQTRLAKAAGVERSTLGEVIEKLVARHLVSRGPSPADRRSYALTLSPEGRAFLDDLMPRVHTHEEAVMAPLDDTERHELLRLLGKLVGL